MEKKQYIEAGRIVNTHGVAGEVKIEVWLDSPQFLKSFRRCFIDKREVKLLSSPPGCTRAFSSQSWRTWRT